jgi:hypothetical protein
MIQYSQTILNCREGFARPLASRFRVPTENHLRTGNIEVPFENKKFEQKPNGGSLFRNKQKKDAKSPEYGGSAVVNGVEYKVSAWINETGNGERYMRLSFSEKR